MVISCVKTSNLKYVRLWKLKSLGKETRCNQGNCGKSASRRTWNNMACIEEGMRSIERNDGRKLEQNLLTPASRDNDIKTDVVAVAVVILTSWCISTHRKLLFFSLTIKNAMNWLVQIFDRFVMPNQNFRIFYFSQNILKKLEMKTRPKKAVIIPDVNIMQLLRKTVTKIMYLFLDTQKQSPLFQQLFSLNSFGLLCTLKKVIVLQILFYY